MCQIEELEAGTPGRLKVTAKSTESDDLIEGEYNTVSIDHLLPFCYWNYSRIIRKLFLLYLSASFVLSPELFSENITNHVFAKKKKKKTGRFHKLMFVSLSVYCFFLAIIRLLIHDRCEVV